jgi:hypothetical protein
VSVPSPKGSLLVKSLREDEDKMEELTVFRVKYQEAGQSQLSNAFDTNLGIGKQCGRKECPIFKQAETGVDCKARKTRKMPSLQEDHPSQRKASKLENCLVPYMNMP